MSVIDCDYLPIEKVVFPPELALLIIRKAAAMAEAFESQALDQMTKDARRALAQDAEPNRVIREMRLQKTRFPSSVRATKREPSKTWRDT